MSELLDAVDALTVPQKTQQQQDIIQDGKVIGQQSVSVELDSLFDQLDEAIRSDIGSTARGASLAHERSILDADALFKFMQITAQVASWCHMVGVVARGKPGDNLRAWYVATLTHPLKSEEWHVRMLESWAGYIRAKLDPWRERELPDVCPICGSGEWWRDGERYLHPLIIKFKPDGPDMLNKARALCRACEQTWGVRELAYDLEHPEEVEARHAEAG